LRPGFWPQGQLGSVYSSHDRFARFTKRIAKPSVLALGQPAGLGLSQFRQELRGLPGRDRPGGVWRLFAAELSRARITKPARRVGRFGERHSPPSRECRSLGVPTRGATTRAFAVAATRARGLSAVEASIPHRHHAANATDCGRRRSSRSASSRRSAGALQNVSTTTTHPHADPLAEPKNR
jgi:hypothetical protein